MSKAGVAGVAFMIAVAAYACQGPDESVDSAASQAATPPVAAASAPPTTSWTAPTTAAAPATSSGSGYWGSSGPGGNVTVTKVIDGDTFVVSGNRKIRVLGIDSCEAGTTGGSAATSTARTLLGYGAVTLSIEPGVDLDKYGRELRYVRTAPGDLGELMVGYDHTAVYRGGNNGSAAYVAGLSALDVNGRSCGTTIPTSTTRRPKPAPTTTVAAPRPVAPSRRLQRGFGCLLQELRRGPRRRRRTPPRRPGRLPRQARSGRRRHRLRVEWVSRRGVSPGVPS